MSLFFSAQKQFYNPQIGTLFTYVYRMKRYFRIVKPLRLDSWKKLNSALLNFVQLFMIHQGSFTIYVCLFLSTLARCGLWVKIGLNLVHAIVESPLSKLLKSNSIWFLPVQNFSPEDSIAKVFLPIQSFYANCSYKSQLAALMIFYHHH